MTLENSILPRTTVSVSGIDKQPQSAFSASPVNSGPSKLQALPPASIPRTLHFARAGRSSQPSDNAVRLATELVQQQDRLGHYGLTAATVLHDQSPADAFSATAVPPPPPCAPPICRPAHAWRPPECGGLARPSAPSRPQRKRSVDASNIGSSTVRSPPAKKPRRPPPGWIDLGHVVPPQTLAEAFPVASGTSPLFFSSSSQSPSMPKRPPHFAAPDSAGAMLNRMREEQGMVRTVKLPKGHVSSASPAKGHTLGTPGSIGSDSVSSRSGDTCQLPPELRDLQGLSIIDLLEADERPTFIIDLLNSSNFGPGPLTLLFANAALRASQRVNELVSQSIEHSSDYSRFKAWAVSFVKDQRSMDVCLPSLSYGGISWTCSTLANRFRFISGSVSAVSITPTSPVPPARATSILEQRSRGPVPSHDLQTPSRERALSDLDYFGDAPLEAATTFSRRAHSEPRDLGDLRPDTPVIQSHTDIALELPESELVQTFDWTRISDVDGKSTSFPSPFLFALPFLRFTLPLSFFFFCIPLLLLYFCFRLFRVSDRFQTDGIRWLGLYSTTLNSSEKRR